jgi:hypothetical protein
VLLDPVDFPCQLNWACRIAEDIRIRVMVGYYSEDCLYAGCLYQHVSVVRVQPLRHALFAFHSYPTLYFISRFTLYSPIQKL